MSSSIVSNPFPTVGTKIDVFIPSDRSIHLSNTSFFLSHHIFPGNVLAVHSRSNVPCSNPSRCQDEMEQSQQTRYSKHPHVLQHARRVCRSMHSTRKKQANRKERIVRSFSHKPIYSSLWNSSKNIFYPYQSRFRRFSFLYCLLNQQYSECHKLLLGTTIRRKVACRYFLLPRKDSRGIRQ